MLHAGNQSCLHGGAPVKTLDPELRGASWIVNTPCVLSYIDIRKVMCPDFMERE